MPRVVDLAAYNTPGIRVFAGRDRGEAARAAAKLAEADAAGDTVEVRIPDDVFSINSSFFLGMFGNSIRGLGEAEFRKRYSFVGRPVDMVLEDTIREALRTASPLDTGVGKKGR
jgi:hypothetical protein